MDAFDMIMTRRSTRSFKTICPSDEEIEKVLQSGQFAPSGGNCQYNHFLVIKNQMHLEKLAFIVQSELAKIDIQPTIYKSLKNAITSSKNGTYIFHYNAPVLIIILNHIGHENAPLDSACALENMLLAANALDLGACWINQLNWLNKNPEIIEYLKKLGMNENECAYGSLALGYANTYSGLPNREIVPRTGNLITLIS